MTSKFASKGTRAARVGLLFIVPATAFAACRSTPPPTDSPPTVVAPPAGTIDPAAGLPTPDFSSILQPGSDTVPKLMRASLSPDERPANPEWLNAMAAIQIARAPSLATRNDFRFRDALPESGITFRHKPVPDGAAAYKPNQYDHGNPVVVADVDGDGLLDLYFVSQYGRNELWRNIGDGTFEDITETAGVAFEDKVGVAASFADLDNDGDPDLYVTSVRFGNELYENDGTGRFTNVTAGSGLGYEGHSSAVDFFDYNNDGLLDVFLSNVGVYTTDELVDGAANPFFPEQDKRYPYYVGTQDAFEAHLVPERSEPSLLFRNEGGLRFTDVTTEVGAASDAWNGDALPFDANGDGWIDLYLINMQGNDVYLENEGGARFVDKSLDVFPNTPWGATGGVTLDFDNDGRQELYIVDMHSDMTEDVSPALDNVKARAVLPEALTRSEGRSIWGNAMLRLGAEPPYVDVSDAVGVETMWPWGATAADLNADGFEDLFVTASMNFGFRYHTNAVLLNELGRRFVNSEFTLGVEPRRDGRVYKGWFSIDCAADPTHSLCEGTGQTGRVYAFDPYGSRASVAFDIDGDGDLDVVTNDFGSEPQVFMSDLAEQGAVNHLVVHLTGTDSNRDGLGSTVSVEAGENAYHQLHDGQSGYLGQSSMPLYFGLGDHVTVDRVVVRWPSGLVQTVPGPFESGTRLEITEGSATR